MSELITYEELKQFYKDFKKNPPEKDYDRLVLELKHLKQLLRSAYAQELKDDIEKYEKAMQETIETLEDMGFKVEI